MNAIARNPEAATGDASAMAAAFVAAHRERASRLGRDLAELVDDPEAFAATLREGLACLADPAFLAAAARLAPGTGPLAGVRTPLQAAIRNSFSRATRRDRPDALLWLAERLLREELMEARWFAIGLTTRLLASDPERSWQLLRRAAHAAADWVTVDILAHPYGRGILAEPYRWAELEQLVYAPSRWERRLVGSTLATLPYLDRVAGRRPEVAGRSLALVGELIGDAEADVQRALAWALRSLTLVDPTAVGRFCAAEADRAARTGDGYRAWVVRDALSKLEPGLAARLRARLTGIRRPVGRPATSNAALAARRFLGGIPGAAELAEAPL